MPKIKYLYQAELSRFFSVITDIRDKALFATIYHYGLRVREAPLLLLDDVDFCQRTIFIRRVKGGVDGSFPLLTNTATLLKQYLCDRQSSGKAGSALFTGRQGCLGKRRIQQLFRKYASEAGIDSKYTVHSLRHSIATHLLDAGLDLSYVQTHLAHAKISSTKVYAQITDKRRIEAFRIIEESPEIVKLI